MSGFTQNQYLGTYPKIFQFSRIEFGWDFIPGRDHISARLTLGLRKLPQASRFPQRARIRNDACLLCVCQTPPGGPDRVFHASRPSRGVVSCVALGLPGHPPKGVVPRYPPRGVLRDCSRHVPGSCRGVVSPLSGGFPHRNISHTNTHVEAHPKLSGTRDRLACRPLECAPAPTPNTVAQGGWTVEQCCRTTT